MVEYPELKQYVSTYFRLTRKLTAVKNLVMDSLNLYTAKEIYITNNLYKYIKEVM